MSVRGRNRRVGILSGLVGLALLVGCGAASTTKTFRVKVPTGSSAYELFQAAETHAVDLCLANDKLVEVTWTFSKSDSDNPIVVEYQKTPHPQRQPCSAVRASVENGSLTPESTSTTAKKTK